MEVHDSQYQIHTKTKWLSPVLKHKILYYKVVLNHWHCGGGQFIFKMLWLHFIDRTLKNEGGCQVACYFYYKVSILYVIFACKSL